MTRFAWRDFAAIELHIYTSSLKRRTKRARAGPQHLTMRKGKGRNTISHHARKQEQGHNNSTCKEARAEPQQLIVQQVLSLHHAHHACHTGISQSADNIARLEDSDLNLQSELPTTTQATELAKK